MAIFRYRIPNFAGGDSMPPPTYDVHSTDDIVNCKHMKHFSEHNNDTFIRFSKRVPDKGWGQSLDIIAEFNDELKWCIIGHILNADFEVNLPEFKL